MHFELKAWLGLGLDFLEIPLFSADGPPRHLGIRGQYYHSCEPCGVKLFVSYGVLR